MGLRSDLIHSRLPLGGFIAIGTGWGGFAAAMPALKAQLGYSEAEMGAALFFAAGGALAAMAFSPQIIARSGSGKGSVTLGILPLALGFALLSQVGNGVPLVVAFLLMGLSSGYLDVIINARLSATEARTGRHLMSLNHGCFSLAYAVAAFSMGLGRESPLDLPSLYLCLGAAILAVALLSLRDPGFEPEQEHPGVNEPIQTRKLPSAVWWTGLIIMFAFFGENATEVWSALHIEQTLGGRAAEGALGPTLLGLTMALGRFSGQGLSQRFGPERVMQVSAILGATGGTIAALAPTPLVAYVGFALLGLGVSTLAPLAFALGGRLLPARQRALGIARMSLVGYMGFFLGPPLLGLLAEAFGLRTAFLVVAGAQMLVPLLLSRLPRAVSPDAPSQRPSHKAQTPKL